jgi:hypothetical protein
MAKTLPVVLTPVHDQETAINRPTTEQAKKKLIQNINHLGMLKAVGSIELVQINQYGVSIPDTGVWQICNGDEITNPYSPLRTDGLRERFTPDVTNRFIHCSTTTTDNSTGGSQLFNLNHAHGGTTQSYIPLPIHKVGDDGDERYANNSHAHAIFPDLNNSQNIDYPAGLQLAAYMKIA